MAKKPKPSKNGTPETPDAITAVSIKGFKSIGKELELEIRPLTILAGVNSSGKTSVMQPLLLMKQTLEYAADPGPLLLDGPNVRFSMVDQMYHFSQRRSLKKSMAFGGRTRSLGWYRSHFESHSDSRLEIAFAVVELPSLTMRLEPKRYLRTDEPFRTLETLLTQPPVFQFQRVVVRRDRCFLDAHAMLDNDFDISLMEFNWPQLRLRHHITMVLHIPGLRVSPLRSYPLLAVGENYPGTFDQYTASVIAAAQDRKDDTYLQQLYFDLIEIGLTNSVSAHAIDDTRIELKVGRLPKPKRGKSDLLSIADVGFGVSQTLPVVVALLTAKPGQLVYIEQPEIHLHPRAQHAMAGLIVRAANRGVRCVIETHSSILLLGIQSRVAKGEIDPKIALLHWFDRDDNGDTHVTTREFTEAGQFGDWPADFADVSLHAQQEYLDAAAAKLLK